MSTMPRRPDYIVEMQSRAKANRFHPETNKEGSLNMLLAENALMWPEMQAKIQEVTAKPMPAWVSKYADYTGELEFKKALANMIQKYWIKKEVKPEDLAITAGAGAIIESLFWLLTEEGDSAIIPGPIYPSFMIDAYSRCKVNLQVAQTKEE